MGGGMLGKELFTDRKWVNNHCHLPQEDFLRNQQVLMENPPFPIDSQRPRPFIPLSSSKFKKKNIQKPIKNLPKYHSTHFPSIFPSCHLQWIGLRENLQESPIFNRKIYGFL
jgi:hypothetical protein